MKFTGVLPARGPNGGAYLKVAPLLITGVARTTVEISLLRAYMTRIFVYMVTTVSYTQQLTVQLTLR